MARPRRLGKYELLDRIGSGGVAEAWLARVAGAGRFEKLVVVKTLQRALAEDAELLALFLEEARLCSSLAHPNVVATFDFGEVDGAYYLAMEYVEGRTLRYLQEVLQPAGKLPPAMAVHIVAQLCRGLEYAHSLKDPSTDKPLKVVHRDVSAQNVMLSFGGDVKILDFGIATFASRDFRTAAGVVRGKLRYMAPEQALGEKLDRRADLFAAGVILWELLHGPRPLPDGSDKPGGLSDAEMLQWVAKAEFPAPTATLPAELQTLLGKALQADPIQRLGTCGELATALIRIASNHWPEFTQVDLARLLEAELGPEIRADRTRVAALLANPGGAGEETALEIRPGARQDEKAAAIGPQPDTTEKRADKGRPEHTDTVSQPGAGGAGLKRVTQPGVPVPAPPRAFSPAGPGPARWWVVPLVAVTGAAIFATGTCVARYVGGGAATPQATVALVESPTPASSSAPGTHPAPVSHPRPARLSVSVEKGWAEVWIDGRRVRSETPLIDYEVPPGTHEVMVVRDSHRASRAVSLVPGERLTVVLSLARE